MACPYASAGNDECPIQILRGGTTNLTISRLQLCYNPAVNATVMI